MGSRSQGYAASRIKKTLTGSGKAGKEQMQHAIQVELGLDKLPEPHDVADACAVALCHFQIARNLRASTDSGQMTGFRPDGGRGRGTSRLDRSGAIALR